MSRHINTVPKRKVFLYSQNPIIVPPEPNGFLHIGHSKAIAINFGFARYHGGECYLRFDDTNPAGEKKEYDDSIEDTVRWLGFTPKKITHSSDNFDRLYELAEALIQKDGAYVCHCTSRSFPEPPKATLVLIVVQRLKLSTREEEGTGRSLAMLAHIAIDPSQKA